MSHFYTPDSTPVSIEREPKETNGILEELFLLLAESSSSQRKGKAGGRKKPSGSSWTSGQPRRARSRAGEGAPGMEDHDLREICILL